MTSRIRGNTAAPPWEAFLERGRLEEKNGRMAQAELAYRKALRANPNFNSLEREFARFLESRGRAKESEAHLLRAMKLGWPRAEGEETLARLREKSHTWPDEFSALLCARKYAAAFRLADAELAKTVRLPNAFLWPWWSKVSSRGSDTKIKFCISELERVSKAAESGEHPGWFAYCRGVLLISLGRFEEAQAEYERVKALDPARYSLMHHPFVMDRLLARDFKWTIKNCRALLKHAPEYWWFQCRMAEAYMAGGDVKRGLREFEIAAAGATAVMARQSIMTWHGAALLWAGEYRRALSKLAEAAGLGTRFWVDCWRGAAHLMLGEHEKALTDLDQAIKADPQDLEAYLWRGEAYRLLGRNAEAMRDLDRAIALDGLYAWGYFNRALLRGDMGDAKGMAADFASIPPEIIAALRAPKSGKSAVPGPKEMRRILEAGLKRAKGIRRPELYLNAIWMGRHG